MIARKPFDGFQPEAEDPSLVGMDGDHDHLEPEELLRQLNQGFSSDELSELNRKTEPLILWSE